MMNLQIAVAALVILAPLVLQSQPQPDPSQSPVVLVLPEMDKAVVRRDVVFATPSTGPLRFDLYRPREAAATEALPAVVFISGGADVRAWKWYESYGRLAAARSMVGVVPEKRYPRGFEGMQTGYADTDSVLGYLRRNASSLGIDPDRICVWAFSAGGRLMSMALAENARVRCIVGFYPLADASGEFASVADTLERDRLLSRYSPSHVLRRRGSIAPPVFLVRAGRDTPVINESIDRFVAAATAANADFTFVNYPEGLHGFDAYNDTATSRRIIRDAFDFIIRRTAAAKSPQ